jgi:hypothetical protein
MNAVYKHLDTSKWCGFLSGKALIHPETFNRVVILKSSIYHACKWIRTMSNTLQSGNIVKLESIAEVFANLNLLQLAECIRASADKGRHHLDVSRCIHPQSGPLNQCRWIYIIFANFFLLLIWHELAEYFYLGFMWIGAELVEISGILPKHPKTELFQSVP